MIIKLRETKLARQHIIWLKYELNPTFLSKVIIVSIIPHFWPILGFFDIEGSKIEGAFNKAMGEI